jgi:hypothetical protein
METLVILIFTPSKVTLTVGKEVSDSASMTMKRGILPLLILSCGLFMTLMSEGTVALWKK